MIQSTFLFFYLIILSVIHWGVVGLISYVVLNWQLERPFAENFRLTIVVPLLESARAIEQLAKHIEKLAKAEPWRFFVGVGSLFLILLGVWANLAGVGLAPQVPATPTIQPTMHGDIRIAVAGFSAGSNTEIKTTAHRLARDVYERLAKTLRDLDVDFTITVWSPEQVGQIVGNDAQERADSAHQIAEKINANVIIYGIVERKDGLWEVQPEFFIATSFIDAKSSANGTEIVGSYKLGAPFTLQTEEALGVETSRIFAVRSTILSTAIVGLWYYAEHMYERALAYFQSIDNDGFWEDVQGREILYLFIGNCQGKLNELALAQEAFQKSLSIDPEYARSYIGLANVYYLLALRPAGSQQEFAKIDQTILEQAEITYKEALTVLNQPVFADIDAKVHFGLGQIYLVRSLASTVAPIQPAVTEFTTVLELYADGSNPRLAELAAESHARLGLIFAIQEQIDRAAEQYRLAAATTDDLQRKAYYMERLQALMKGHTTDKFTIE